MIKFPQNFAFNQDLFTLSALFLKQYFENNIKTVEQRFTHKVVFLQLLITIRVEIHLCFGNILKTFCKKSCR